CLRNGGRSTPPQCRAARPRRPRSACMRSTEAQRSLARRLELRHGQRAVDLLRQEAHLIARLHLLEHGRILDPEDHGHCGHVQIGERAVPEGDLLRVLSTLRTSPSLSAASAWGPAPEALCGMVCACTECTTTSAAAITNAIL